MTRNLPGVFVETCSDTVRQNKKLAISKELIIGRAPQEVKLLKLCRKFDKFN